MALILICPTRDAKPWVTAIKGVDPHLEVRVWPEAGVRDEIVFALTWQHPHGALRDFTHLKCISSMGAGVDHLLADPHLPPGIPLVRLVDRSLIHSMSEYVTLAVLNHFREFDTYKRQQRERQWRQKQPRRASECGVGILGMGQLGGSIALRLHDLGFPMAGWSRTPKSNAAIDYYHGRGQFMHFLSLCNVLICLLPLTAETRNILNRGTFLALPPGAYIVNVARGEHLVETDLLDCIESGHLSGACLDVFRSEPLPATHPFWGNPKITVTPHISSITDPCSVAPQIVENYKRAQSGRPLLNQIDVHRGY